MTYYLEVRETHKYRDGWSDEDQWRYVGKADIIDRVRIEEDDYGGSYRSELTAKVFDVEDASSVRQALFDTFSGSQCTHEYDCCGCASTSVTDVEQTAHSVWKISTLTTFNY